METYANPFAFLLLGWSGGFASSVAIHFVVKAWSVRHIEKIFEP